MSANSRLAWGIALLVIGAILPLGIFLLPMTDWPVSVKGAVGGVLFFGFEIMAVPAAAVMGKENFDRIVAKAKGLLGMLKPAGEVGKVRHAIGLVLFLLPLVPTYIMAYMPKWLPDNSPKRLWVSICSDVIFLVSLFVLGGDFWDKLRALFVREARAVFPGEVTRDIGHRVRLK